MAYTDKTLTCADCQAPFLFSARDQEFHASKGFANEPKRCPNCRQARRLQRGDTPAGAAPRPGGQPIYSGPRAQAARSTGAGGRGNAGGRPRGGGRRDFDRNGDGAMPAGMPRSFEGGNGESPRSYTATCMACGKETPISADAGNRVVFCPECFSKMNAMVSR